MKINFTLWHTTKGGGARHIFEVSNRLIERGHKVTITALGGDHRWFPLKADVNYVKLPKVLEWMKVLGYYTKRKYGRPFRYSDIRHILRKLSFNRIDINLTKSLADAIPECDINVATFCFTVPAVCMSKKGVVFHYVQGYDPMMFDKESEKKLALESFSLPMKRVVVSKWLQDRIFKDTGKKPVYVGNGVDTKVFHPIKKPYGHTVMAMIRGVRWKRSVDVIKVLNNVASKIPDVKLIAIGSDDTLEYLEKFAKPKFDVEVVNPENDKELVDVYSSSNILLFTSDIEGFGLPPLEAMTCGLSVVTTDCLGTRDFCINGYNSLVCKPGDIGCLTKNTLKVLTNEPLAKKLSKNGAKTAKKWSWERVVGRLEYVFKKALNEN